MTEVYTPQEITSMMNLVDTYIRHRTVTQRGDRSYAHYHPSEWGKAQPLDSGIQTPDGPKKMGDIKVGEEVCGVEGDVNIVELIHPQGLKDVYKVTFADGDSVECCGDHLWEVDSSYLGFASPKILTTKKIFEGYISKAGIRVYKIKTPSSLYMKNNAPSIINPYVMGVLLGDGCLRCNSVDFTSVDEEIVERIRKNIQDDYEIHSWKKGVQHRIKKIKGKKNGKFNIYKKELKKYKLYKLHSCERFIPDEYLYVKIKDREELLKGLMDTDGTIDSRGYPRFSTKSYTMAQQLKWLIESLGGVCIIRDKVSKCDGKTFYSYRCDIKFNNSSDLFYLSRKRERGKERDNDVNRIISNIEIIEKKECQCITVSNSNGLYLTDNCVITHNCLRMQQYKHYAWLGKVDVVYEEPVSQKHRLFDKGHNMHARWSNYFDQIGNVLIGGWQCKNPLCNMFDDNGKLDLSKNPTEIYKTGKSRLYGYGEDVDPIFRPEKCKCGHTEFEYVETMVSAPEINMKGHADILLNCDNLKEERFKGVRISYNKDFLPTGGSRVVGDMKTIGSKPWVNQLIKKGPHKDYMIQLTIYVHILKADYGMIMYENKDTSEMKWFHVPRNDKWWEVVQWQAKKMIEMAKPDADGKVKLPPPKYATKRTFACGWCEFKNLCHKSAVWDNPKLERNRREFYKDLL